MNNRMESLIKTIKEYGLDEEEVCILDMDDKNLYFECGGKMSDCTVNKKIMFCPFCGKELLSK